jgi:hypothetical protein
MRYYKKTHKNKTRNITQKGAGNVVAKNKVASTAIEEVNENTYDGHWDLPIMSVFARNKDENNMDEKSVINKKFEKKNENSVWCFHLMLHRENLYSNSEYVVFYHSFLYSHILYDVQTAIAEILYNLKSDINRVVPRLSNMDFKNININNVKTKTSKLKNHNKDIRKLLMSAACSLFADIELNIIRDFESGYSCADMKYKQLLQNLLIECNTLPEQLDELFTQIITHQYVPEKIRKGYLMRPSCYLNENYGQILQIFIKKTILDEIVYKSQPYGIPDESPGDCASTTNQVRILASPEYFMNPDLVRIYRYASNKDTHKNRPIYIAFLKELLQKTLFDTQEKIENVKRKLNGE